MKRILLFSILLLIISNNMLFSQDNPCPTVGTPELVNTTNNGNGTCTSRYKVHITNDVSSPNPKPVKFEVFSGSSLLTTDCFIASILAGGDDYLTSYFTYPCNTVPWWIITEYTASNGQCQGGVCQIITLPVTFGKFTTTRSKTNVTLNWDTYIEQNNRGFAVERLTGNAEWTSIGFVASKADNGNSSSALDYEFTDVNTNKGITQYRLKQVDIDNRSSYSAIRAVRGEGQIGKTIVYPNPTTNGSTTVVFDDSNITREITLLDLNGKKLKQWQLTTNVLSITGLSGGIYFLRILSETSVQSVEKILVQ